MEMKSRITHSCPLVVGCSRRISPSPIPTITGSATLSLSLPKLRVHLLMVPPEVIAAGKALPTLGAFKHFLPQVKHLVGFKALRPAEALAALGAAVGPHPRVLPLVTLQVSGLAKALPAVGAQVGLLPRVSPEVHGELAVVREAFAAVGTRVRLLARVHALVLLQAVMVGESFAAVRAQVEHLHLLEARVSLELFGASTALAAVGAHVPAPPFLFLRHAVGVAGRQVLGGVVPLDVFDQVALHGEGELAEGAGEELGGAVVLDAGVALLMLPEAARRHEDFVAAFAADVGQSLVHGLLVPLQEAGLHEGRPALTALVLSQHALVGFQLRRVRTRSIAAAATEPPSRGGRVRLRGFGLSWSGALFGDDHPPLWSNELGYGRDSGPGSEPLRPLCGMSSERFGGFRTRGLQREVWIAARVIRRLHCHLL